MFAIENLLPDVPLDEGDALSELALISEPVDRFDRLAFGRLFRLLKFNDALPLSMEEGERLSSELTELLFAVEVTLVSTFEVPPDAEDVSLFWETLSMDDTLAGKMVSRFERLTLHWPPFGDGETDLTSWFSPSFTSFSSTGGELDLGFSGFSSLMAILFFFVTWPLLTSSFIKLPVVCSTYDTQISRPHNSITIRNDRH